VPKTQVNQTLYRCFTGTDGRAAIQEIAESAKLGLQDIQMTDVPVLNYARKLLRSAGYELVLQRKAEANVALASDEGNAIDNFLEEDSKETP